MVHTTDSFEYTKLFTTSELTSWQKCAYIPVASTFTGVVDIIQAVAKNILGVICCIVGGALFAVSASCDALILNWLNFPLMMGISLINQEQFHKDAIVLGRAIIQIVPFVGNGILAYYDVRNLES